MRLGGMGPLPAYYTVFKVTGLMKALSYFQGSGPIPPSRIQAWAAPVWPGLAGIVPYSSTTGFCWKKQGKPIVRFTH